MDSEVAIDAHARIGESPVWCPAENALYWIDIKQPALHRYVPRSGEKRHWPVTADIGAFALAGGGTAIVALRSGIHRLDLRSGALELLAPAPFDQTLFRFNEGACDPTGRFWVGVMYDPLDASLVAAKQAGALHSFTVAGGLREEPDVSSLHNGMAWSQDGRRFFLSHSYSGEIFAFAFDPVRGEIGERRLFAKVPATLGIPDGAALDRMGNYWCALHGGGRLRRFRADGSFDADITLPVSQPTMCAFGGPRLETLFVTSAAAGLSPEQARDEPLAGAVLRLESATTGLASTLFDADLRL